MEIRTFTHTLRKGWSATLPTGMDSERTLLLAFGASAYQQRPKAWQDLRTAFPRSVIAGCSSAGEILGARVTDDHLAVAAIALERSRVAHVTTPIAGATDSVAAGERLAAALAPHAPSLVLVFSDGLAVNGTDLVRGLRSTLPPATVIAGGLAADGSRFERTWVVIEGAPRTGWVSAVGLSGPLSFATGTEGGWDAFGPERRVTRSEGSVLYELDGRPALALYKEYLGDLAAGLPATALHFPLTIRDEAGEEEPVVRTILAVDDATQSMTFAGDIPTGYHARLMRARVDRLVDGAARAARDAHPAAGDGQPALALAVSCVGRRLVLGQRIEEETEAVLEALPSNVTQIGFYSYGEIAPRGFTACQLHNQTMTVTTFREHAA